MNDFRNIVFDHAAYNLEREMYAVYHVVLATLFGYERIVYSLPHALSGVLPDGTLDSQTFALKTGSDNPLEPREVKNSICAFVQPLDDTGHLAQTLRRHTLSAMVNHIAFRTSNLPKLHGYLLDHGVNFVTPIMVGHDSSGELLQVFAGELNHPSGLSSGLFTEFLQRGSGKDGLFQDDTFHGLYAEKDKESERGESIPFIDHDLFVKILKVLRAVGKRGGSLSSRYFDVFEMMMRNYAFTKISKKS